MDLIAYIFLGILQGIAEWLPVSSQGQLMLAGMAFFGMLPSRAIELSVWLHLGTMLSALVYFRREVAGLLRRFPAFVLLIASGKHILVKQDRVSVRQGRVLDEHDKLTFFLIVSTFFSGLVGIPLYVFLKKSFVFFGGEAAVALIGFFLIVTGVMLYGAGSGTFGNRKITDLGLKDAVFTGVLQGFSVLPGISRSGTSTAALLFMGFRQEDSLKISFLMSIIVVGAAELVFGLFEGFSFSTGSLVALLFAFVSGFLSIGVLLKVAKKVRFWLFCIALGVVSLIPFIFSVVFS
ncbi:MAG: undecaprenyl-diphosphate phosphatase [Candidatus Diapherotrites archaeon]|nr:undecaprenyl-diphosphate phosphatase [Candidatus Diapherotrites archaeon]